MKLRLLCFSFVSLATMRAIDLTALDAYNRKARDDWRTPGFAIAIVQDDKVLVTRGYGVRELNRPEPVTGHTLFAIASNTKAFTAAGIAILVHQKKLKWNDRVQTHLPWFQVFDDAWISHETRLDDLLCHRMGFRTFGGDLIWWNTSYSAEEVVRRARFLKPAFGFRAGNGYSNIAFIAAGEIIGRASQSTWPDFIRQQILSPLGMTNTVLSVSELPQRSDVATPHGADDDGRPYAIAWQGWDNCAAAGGIISSVTDLSQWLRLQLNEGKLGDRTLWSPKEAWKMWSMHNPAAMAPGSLARDPSFSLKGRGLGWGLADYKGELVVSHGGAYDGMFSHTVMVPRKKIGIVVLSNGMTGLPSSVASYALDALLGANDRDWSAENLKKAAEARATKQKTGAAEAAKRIPNTSPSRPLEQYAGRYGGPMYGDATITHENNRLILRFQPNPELAGELVHWQHDEFEIKWHKKFAWFGDGKVRFFLDRESRPIEFRMDVPNEDFWFDELEFRRK